MSFYARYYSELPTSFAKARNSRKGELKKFDTLVKARRYGARETVSGGVVMIYSRNIEHYAYAIDNPLQASDVLGYVDFHKHMNWHYWNIPDHRDKNTGEVYFRSRPMYRDGKMAGRF